MSAVLLSLLVYALPQTAKAQALGVPNGGLDVGDDYGICDCSGAVYTWFAPLYIVSTPVTGPLAWYPGTFAFSNYIVHPSAWELGFYTPGIQVCWTYVGEGCAVVYTMGMIDPETGTSL